MADSLEAAQSRVALQALGNRRTALGAHLVAAKTATTEGTTREMPALKAADAKASAEVHAKVRRWAGVAGALQRRDLGLVEHCRDHLAALDTKAVAHEAARQCKGTWVRSVIGC